MPSIACGAEFWSDAGASAIGGLAGGAVALFGAWVAYWLSRRGAQRDADRQAAGEAAELVTQIQMLFHQPGQPDRTLPAGSESEHNRLRRYLVSKALGVSDSDLRDRILLGERLLMHAVLKNLTQDPYVATYRVAKYLDESIGDFRAGKRLHDPPDWVASYADLATIQEDAWEKAAGVTPA